MVTFFGFAIIDFAPAKTGFYWLVAGPPRGALSGVLGARASRAMGQRSTREDRAIPCPGPASKPARD